MNQTWYGNNKASERTGASSTNTKALKNFSKEAHTLIEHRPMQHYASKMAADDHNQFMNVNLKKRKPIFKNYIHCNASILRKEVQTSKL